MCEDHRGTGWGKTLLRHMLQQAPELQIANVIALIFAHNQTSVRLFQQFGFTQWGCLSQVCDLGEQWHDVWILGKQITS